MENFDKIEKSVTVLIREWHRLREANEALEKDNGALRAQLDEALTRADALDLRLKRMNKLEEANRKYAEDQDQIRTRVKTLLKQLEKIKIA